MSSKPTIVAHRGLHDRAPENSARAFQYAVEAGFAWVECDVWPSADGMPIVIHDQTLDRTTWGHGEVSRQPSASLAEVQLKSQVSERVPFLSEICTTIGPTCGVLVEIKPWNARDFVTTTIEILRIAARGPWVIQSFDPENLRHVQAIDPTIPLALLVETPAQLARGIKDQWRSIHAKHDLLHQPGVDAIRASGGTVGAWTVNTEDDIRRMIELGVDMIITDEPRRVRQLIGRR